MRLRIRQALISVSDKSGVVELARALRQFDVSILSTGGTAKLLADNGVAATEVADYTGYPEMLDGRLKTLHPRIHGGILARRDLADHMNAIKDAGTEPIDLVVVNLYPFSQTVARPECTLADAVENIDIGGPTMVRAAAKNFSGVAVVTDPADYDALLEELRANRGALGLDLRYRLAQKAFSHTASYDGAISNYLTSTALSGERAAFPQQINFQFAKVQDLRYGENPHQQAAFYRDLVAPAGTLAHYRQVQGKELSYNNIADADAAWECVKTFAAPACVIVKHANPCGVATAGDVLESYRNAFATDPTSAFGGIIAFNRAVDEVTAEAVGRQFVEVVIAPEYTQGALERFASKQNVRLLQIALHHALPGADFKRVGGGVLIQSADSRNVGDGDLRIVSKRTPTPAEQLDLLFAWRVAKFVKSNAIVFCGNQRTLGIGAGQMSRIDSTRIAAMKAQGAGLALAGSVVASDAFFPFRDGVDALAQAGATAVIQPGGSVRDEEVIAAANEHGLAMVFTGIRHFRH